MRFHEKADENLEAAARLLPDESGELDALSNASASRSYYAVYHAIADKAQQEGVGFTDRDRTYYRHDTLPRDALRWGIVDEEAGDDLRWLYGLRIKSDYHEDQVQLDEASDALDIARTIVQRVLGPAEGR